MEKNKLAPQVSEQKQTCKMCTSRLSLQLMKVVISYWSYWCHHPVGLAAQYQRGDGTFLERGFGKVLDEEGLEFIKALLP
jgi:hypothetical protein